MKSPGNQISTGSDYAQRGGVLTFARYREQDQATVPRDIIGDKVLNQLDVPLLSRFRVGDQPFIAGVSPQPP